MYYMCIICVLCMYGVTIVIVRRNLLSTILTYYFEALTCHVGNCESTNLLRSTYVRSGKYRYLLSSE